MTEAEGEGGDVSLEHMCDGGVECVAHGARLVARAAAGAVEKEPTRAEDEDSVVGSK